MFRVMYHARPCVRTVCIHMCSGSTGAALPLARHGRGNKCGCGSVLSSYEQHAWCHDTACHTAGGAMAGGRQPRPLIDVGRRCGDHRIRHPILHAGAWLCAAALTAAGRLVQLARLCSLLHLQ